MVRRQGAGVPDGGQFSPQPRKRAQIHLPNLEHERQFEEILELAARLQRLVPDAVLVGRSATALHAGHRISLDHDHVLADLRDRFDAVLDDIEDDGGWQVNRMAPGKVILGELDGIETGVRQMRRARPLEVEQYKLPSGAPLTVPTIEEALRVKAFLAVQRNQVRDYLDIAALADRIGLDRAAEVLAAIDDYYADQRAGDEAVASQVVRQLADPQPKDTRTIKQFAHYKGLAARWTSWDEVRHVLGQLAEAITLWPREEMAKTSRLRFRNLDVDPSAPVAEWPEEGVQAALERGSLTDYRRVASAVQADPWGDVARRVERVLTYTQPYGGVALMRRVIERSRADADADARAEVARQLRQAQAASGLTQAAFASRLGTSPSRMSTYLRGEVTPSASLLVRALRISQSATG